MSFKANLRLPITYQ